MFTTDQALAGAAIGCVVPRPAVAFALGLASHVAVDKADRHGAGGRV